LWEERCVALVNAGSERCLTQTRPGSAAKDHGSRSAKERSSGLIPALDGREPQRFVAQRSALQCDRARDSRGWLLHALLTLDADADQFAPKANTWRVELDQLLQ
jgi:hypothetical protein